MEPFRAHDNKQTGQTPEINWECTRWHLKSSDYPCDKRRENHPDECRACSGAKKIGATKRGRPRKLPQLAAPQSRPEGKTGHEIKTAGQLPPRPSEPGKTCKEPGCETTKLYGRGYCRKHWKKHVGIDFQTTQTPPEGKYCFKLKGRGLSYEAFISQTAAKEIMMVVLKELDCLS